jgi:hypothetical protein
MSSDFLKETVQPLGIVDNDTMLKILFEKNSMLQGMIITLFLHVVFTIGVKYRVIIDFDMVKQKKMTKSEYFTRYKLFVYLNYDPKEGYLCSIAVPSKSPDLIISGTMALEKLKTYECKSITEITITEQVEEELLTAGDYVGWTIEEWKIDRVGTLISCDIEMEIKHH